MFKFKVGDKVRVKSNLQVWDNARGWYFNGKMATYIGKEVTVSKLYDICGQTDMYILEGQSFVYLGEWLELVQEPKLTPKLIESLDELQEGAYFKDSGGYIHEIIAINYSMSYPIETTDSCFNLEELLYMGAYKVKVEPYELVEVKEEVVEVKPKLYELVGGEDYVKLEEGDEVTFKGGLVYTVTKDDSEDVLYPYKLTIGLLSNWLGAHYFLPENIISINGVNIHEE